MKFLDAIDMCHVRSGIYRTGDPIEIFTEEDLQKMHPALQEISSDMVGRIVPKVYWKNHSILLVDQVPEKDQLCIDWEEYDPRERPECAQYNEMPA